MTKTKDDGAELIGYMENGGFVGIENHEMIAEPLKVSVNKPLTGLSTEHSQRIHGERIEIWKKKLGAHINPNGEMSAVKKEWKGIQKPLKAEAGDISSPSRNYKEPETSGEYEPPTKEYGYPKGASMADTPLGQLKNHVDNIHSWVRYIGAGLLITAIIASVALGGVIFK